MGVASEGVEEEEVAGEAEDAASPSQTIPTRTGVHLEEIIEADAEGDAEGDADAEADMGVALVRAEVDKTATTRMEPLPDRVITDNATAKAATNEGGEVVGGEEEVGTTETEVDIMEAVTTMEAEVVATAEEEEEEEVETTEEVEEEGTEEVVDTTEGEEEEEVAMDAGEEVVVVVATEAEAEVEVTEVQEGQAET
mmetsp:Transcript_26460/g.63868  ORF Transcript_26460/g.63868 Transcript_26460/m.63868 type:complete len:196 (-) Transcript_26460:585-1172(-)